VRRYICSFVLSAFFATGLSASPTATARVEKTLKYTKEQGYNSALRYVRVERGYKVTEKDANSGYLLFEYLAKGSAEKSRGSIEIIKRTETIGLIVRLPQMPHYHERLLANGLLKKLREDYGEPLQKRKVTPTKKGKAPKEKVEDSGGPKQAPKQPNGASSSKSR